MKDVAAVKHRGVLEEAVKVVSRAPASGSVLPRSDYSKETGEREGGGDEQGGRGNILTTTSVEVIQISRQPGRLLSGCRTYPFAIPSLMLEIQSM